MLFAALCSTANAQDPIGTLEGQITDPSSALVSGAEVSVHRAQTELTRNVRSSRDGSFHFSDLPAGEYSLTVNASGFAPFSISPIRIDIGQVVTYPVALQLPGSHAENQCRGADGDGGYQPDHRQYGSGRGSH
jgi:hypothetical protein